MVGTVAVCGNHSVRVPTYLHLASSDKELFTLRSSRVRLVVISFHDSPPVSPSRFKFLSCWHTETVSSFWVGSSFFIRSGSPNFALPPTSTSLMLPGSASKIAVHGESPFFGNTTISAAIPAAKEPILSLAPASFAAFPVAICTNSGASKTFWGCELFHWEAYCNSSTMPLLPLGLQSGAIAMVSPAAFAEPTSVVLPYKAMLLCGDQINPTLFGHFLELGFLQGYPVNDADTGPKKSAGLQY